MGNVSSMFSKSTPDPAAYSNQAAVNAQLQSAIVDLSGTIGRINTAITAAANFNTTRNNLNALKQRAVALQSSAPTMSPVDIEQKRGAIEAELGILQSSITANADMGASDERRLAVSELRTRVAEINADPDISETIKKGYTDFSAQVDLSGSMTAASIRGTLSGMDSAARIDRYKDFVFARMLKFSASVAFQVLYYVILSLSVLFGGIIVSNMYVQEDFWAGRLYYFVYGMAFFPIALLVGMFRPPPWLATIMPFYDISRDGPKSESYWHFIYTLFGVPLFGYNPTMNGSKWNIWTMSILLTISLAFFTYMRGLGKVVPLTVAPTPVTKTV
jgi:hypothetical protein